MTKLPVLEVASTVTDKVLELAVQPELFAVNVYTPAPEVGMLFTLALLLPDAVKPLGPDHDKPVAKVDELVKLKVLPAQIGFGEAPALLAVG